MDFASRVDAILEQGHWDEYKGQKRISFIIDKNSWSHHDEMNSSTGQAKHKNKRCSMRKSLRH